MESECNLPCNVEDPDSGETTCMDGNIPYECKNCCLFDGDVDQPGSGATLNLDFEFPHYNVKKYAEDVFDAINGMIEGNNGATVETSLKNSFANAFTNALKAVAEEVEESLDGIEQDVNHAIADLKDSDEDIELRLEDCTCVR